MAAVEEVRPHLKTGFLFFGKFLSFFFFDFLGVPDFNIPSLEPLEIKDLLTENIAGMHIYFSNVRAFGCTDFIVQDLKYLQFFFLNNFFLFK